MTAERVHRAVDAVWKIESGRIIGALARMTGDVGLAEEIAQEALLAALERWPESGVPDNPGAWLTTVAKRRAVDHLRRDQRRERAHERIAHELATDLATGIATGYAAGHPAEPADGDEPGPFAEDDEEQVRDDLLRLIFVSCHPALGAEARVALTLRVLGGLRTDEIARAFLVPESTVAQRIVRAKRTLAELKVPFAVPGPAERAERLSSVLEVIYLVFNEGYTATSGDDLVRQDLCLEALRLGRILAGLVPDEPEAHGLVALMELQASRAAARTGPSGEPVPLHEQNRGLWDRLLIRRGVAALLRARQAGGGLGPYVLQAAIAVCHAQAASADDTDWRQIAALYEALARVMPTPVVRLNQAVAVAMAYGPEAGLALADALADEPSLRAYHLLPGVRGDLLARLGHTAEARAEFERAAALTRNTAERAALLRRASTLPPAPAPDARPTDGPATTGRPRTPEATPADHTTTPRHTAEPHPAPGARPADGPPTTGHPHAPEATPPDHTTTPRHTAEPHPAPGVRPTGSGPSIDPDRREERTARGDLVASRTLGGRKSTERERDAAPPRAEGVITLGVAVASFLGRPGLDARTVRSYGQTLRRLCDDLGGDLPLAKLTAARTAEVVAAAWGRAAPATWNRHRAAVRSFARWAAGQGWVAGDPAGLIDRRAEPGVRRTPPIPRQRIAALWELPGVSLRERTLWRMLYESAARAERVLALNVQDLDLERREGGDSPAVRWQDGTALLLPRLIAGRTRGPLFLTDRRPGPSDVRDPADLCPETGRARLSYERAEYLFKRATRPLDPHGRGHTLHQLRHSRLTHLAEDGLPARDLQALSGHRNPRSLAPYRPRTRA